MSDEPVDVSNTSTYKHLVIQLVNSFDPYGECITTDNEKFAEAFLRMHKWFTTSVQLFNLLTDKSLCETVMATQSCCLCPNDTFRYQNNLALAKLLTKTDPTVPERLVTQSMLLGGQLGCVNGVVDRPAALMLKDLQPITEADVCRCVCQVIKFWTQRFPLHFDSDEQLFTLFQRYREHLCREDMDLYCILKPCNILSYDWMRKITLKKPMQCDSKVKVSLAFQNLTAEELARHITFIDFKVCRRITFTDYAEYAKSGTMIGNPRLERSVLLSNGLTQWVQLMILSKTTARQRAGIITKFIKVSQQLLKLENYNSLMAVVGGVTHSSLARLSKTLTYLSGDIQKALAELKNIVSAQNNYQAYRKLLRSSTTKYYIPIIGVHLKDLVATHNAFPDYTNKPPVVNFRKMSQISAIMTKLTRLQDLTLPFPVDLDLIDTLKLAFDVFYSEEEIFELSLGREPRINGSSTTPTSSSSSNETLFSEWVTGLKPPDKERIQKHVANMVTALFKNYDLDRDGLISVKEFESIASTFPFLESFCILDIDEDGMLSENEIKRYFLLAKCSVLKNTFTHNFSETTYFRPMYCDHCSGLLWGLIKQGWKCKDCGINAHKSCKDIVVIECKSKATNKPPQSCSPPAQLSPTSSTPDLSQNESRFTFSQKSIRRSSCQHHPSSAPQCRHRQTVGTQTEPQN